MEALGGPAYLNFKRLATRGRAFTIAEGVTAGFAPFDSTVEFPDKRRFSYGKDKPVVLINNGERGWQLDRYGLIRQPPEQVRRWRISNRYALENVFRLRIHEPGILVQDRGNDFVDNLPARVVDIVDSEQVQLSLYIHKTNYLPIRVAYHVQNAQTREWEEYADVYGDYRVFGGIQTPMHITRFLNDERYSEIFRNSVDYDADVPPNYFFPTD